MKITHQCVSCLLTRALYETSLVDETLKGDVIRQTCSIFAKYFSTAVCSATLATEMHQKVYTILGTLDPYKEIKARSNQVALGLLSEAESLIDNSHDRLRGAVICSIAGNVLDFGIPGVVETPEALSETFKVIVDSGLQVDDLKLIKGYLKKDARVLLFTDNCGEIVFDKLLCRELKQFGVHLCLVVKGEPILTDATMADVDLLGLENEVDEVLTTEHFAVGIAFDKISRELSDKIRNADLIICKGMANYEAFSETEHRPIAYFLKAKCKPVARDMGANVGDNVAKLYV